MSSRIINYITVMSLVSNNIPQIILVTWRQHWVKCPKARESTPLRMPVSDCRLLTLTLSSATAFRLYLRLFSIQFWDTNTARGPECVRTWILNSQENLEPPGGRLLGLTLLSLRLSIKRKAICNWMPSKNLSKEVFSQKSLWDNYVHNCIENYATNQQAYSSS